MVGAIMTQRLRYVFALSGIAALALGGCGEVTDGLPTGLDCTDADGDLYCAEGDCDDADPTRHPGAEEIFDDGIDSDCDERELCYADADQDGFRSDTVSVESRDLECTDPGEALSSFAVDCDDNEFLAFPGGTEVPGDGEDFDCDGHELCFADADGDGYRSETASVSDDTDCDDDGEAPFADPTDCDDEDALLYVGTAHRLDDEFAFTGNNTQAQWSYQYTTDLDSDTYLFLPSSTLGYYDAQWLPGPGPRVWSVTADKTPWMGRNTTGATQGLDAGGVPVSVSWPVETFAMTPGRLNKAAVVFKADSAGSLSVAATFTDLAPLNDGVTWSIVSGGTTLATGQLDGTDGDLTGEVSLSSIDVAEDDRVYIVIDPRGPGDDICPGADDSCNDITSLAATVVMCTAPLP
jgi:Putative metal-binding motif